MEQQVYLADVIPSQWGAHWTHWEVMYTFLDHAKHSIWNKIKYEHW